MKRGFTLIELMVSVAIFSVVMVVAMGALLSISAAGRKAETMKSVMNNLNFALENMSRTIRTSTNYHCGTSGGTLNPLTAQDCPDQVNGDTYIAMQANDGTFVAYCFTAGSIWRLKVATANLLSTSCSGADNFLPITAPEVSITKMALFVKGAPIGDGLQPKVVITLSGLVLISSTASSTFNVQTSVTQRVYDQ